MTSPHDLRCFRHFFG